jgi:hypothetical protein
MAEGNPIWHALKDEAARHEYFGDADWALTGEELAAVKELVERHRPTDPMVSDRHAFDDWTPHIGKYVAGAEVLDDATDLTQGCPSARAGSRRRAGHSEAREDGQVARASRPGLGPSVRSPLSRCLS